MCVYRYTLTTNTLIRNNLLHKSGPIDRFTSLGVDGFYALIRRYWSSPTFTLDNLDPVNDLEGRGVDDEARLPRYYYREDALRVWSHLQHCVQQTVALFYDTDNDVIADSELQVLYRARQLYKNSSMLFLFPVKDGKLSTGVIATFNASCYG